MSENFLLSLVLLVVLDFFFDDTGDEFGVYETFFRRARVRGILYGSGSLMREKVGWIHFRDGIKETVPIVENSAYLSGLEVGP